jgi:hypothetical protein
MGVAVPFNTKTSVGYRPLSVTSSELKAILREIEVGGEGADTSKLRELINWANIANDECGEFMMLCVRRTLCLWVTLAYMCMCVNLNSLLTSDFGSSYELGMDLFCSSERFNKAACNVLKTSYRLLERDLYSDILQLHCSRRMLGVVIDILNDKII